MSQDSNFMIGEPALGCIHAGGLIGLFVASRTERELVPF
jgi:hypothetical protein